MLEMFTKEVKPSAESVALSRITKRLFTNYSLDHYKFTGEFFQVIQPAFTGTRKFGGGLVFSIRHHFIKDVRVHIMHYMDDHFELSFSWEGPYGRTVLSGGIHIPFSKLAEETIRHIERISDKRSVILPERDRKKR